MKQPRKALSIALILCTSRARLRCSGSAGDTARIRADGGYIPATAGEK